jgi:hypothetical protein
MIHRVGRRRRAGFGAGAYDWATSAPGRSMVVRSDAATVEEYLDSLPDGRREALEAVREVILRNLPDGYEESMEWGMISYQVPLATYPDTYNKRPLMYAALASQKHHMAVYLTSVWAAPGHYELFREAYRATGKPLDMGKSCVRFKSLDDLPLDLIGDTIASVGVDDFIALNESVH